MSHSVKAALATTKNALRSSAEQSGQPKGGTSQATITPAERVALNAFRSEIDKTNAYSESLSRGLDILQQTHPFVAAAIMAFKAAVSLEITRRENDKRILAVRIAMNDLFAGILLIQKIPEEKIDSIEARLGDRIKTIAEDIEECCTVCDTYQKKSNLVKYFRSPEWEEKFTNFIALFRKHRDDLTNDLSLYLVIEMDQMHDTLANVSKSIQDTDEDTSMIRLLELLRCPEERELQNFIITKGGPRKILRNDKLINQLFEKSDMLRITSSTRKDQTETIQEMKREIKKSVDKLISENFDLFHVKFKAQLEQLHNSIEASIREEGQKTRDALKDGPHNRINDPELRQIWKDMGWKGTVKARSMAMALHEYFAERRKDIKSRGQQSMKSIASIVHSRDESEADKIRGIAEIVDSDRRIPKKDILEYAQDDWALEYITISRIQPLLEALDEDSSTLISVAEVNAFTAARPTAWSLSKWMAFWTAGFPLTLRHYYTHIQLLSWIISGLVPDVLQINSQVVKSFMSSPFFTYATDILMAGVHKALDDICDNDELLQRFKEYMESEQERMQRTLQTLKYRIDAENTLRLVTGPGRLEKYLMPLLYLLFVRVYQVVLCAMTTAVDQKEVDDILESFGVIHEAIGSRMESLKVVCKLQNVDPKVQLQRSAYGIFYYVAYQEDLLASAYWKAMYNTPFIDTFEDKEYEIPLEVSEPTFADVEAVEAIPSGKLLYSIWAESFDVEPYDSSDDFGSLLSSDGSTTTALSSWCGFLNHGASHTKYPAGVIYLPLPENDGLFSGSGSDSIGEFSIEGRVDGEAIIFNKRYTSGKVEAQRYEGKLNADRNQMLGRWCLCDTEQEDFSRRLDSTEVLRQFELYTAPLGIRRFFKVDADLVSSSPSEKWRFAISTVITILHIKRREFPGWTYLQNRRKIRRRFIELFPRVQELPVWGVYDPLSNEEMEELCRLVSCCSRRDLRFYRSLSACLQRRVVVHWGVWCASCILNNQSVITGTRFVCLDCLMNGDTLNTGEILNFDTTDLCADCIDKSVESIADKDNMHHNPLHDMLQLRYCCSFRRCSFLLKAALAITKQLRGEDAKGTVSRICYQCQSILERPYWYCLTCPDNKCICMGCKDQLDSNYDPVRDLKLFYASETPENAISGQDTEGADGTNNNKTNSKDDAINENAAVHLGPDAVYTPGTNNGGEEMNLPWDILPMAVTSCIDEVDCAAQDVEDPDVVHTPGTNGGGEEMDLPWDILPMAMSSGGDDIDRAAQDGANSGGEGENGEKTEGEVNETPDRSNEDSRSDNDNTKDDAAYIDSDGSDGEDIEQQPVEHVYGHTLLLCRAEVSPPEDGGVAKPSVDKQLEELRECFNSMESRIMERLDSIIRSASGPGNEYTNGLLWSASDAS